MTRVRITGGFLNIGRRRPGHPDQGLPETEPGYPDQGLPGGEGGGEYPDHELPTPPPGIWPPPTVSHPIVPAPPDEDGDGTPGSIWPSGPIPSAPPDLAEALPSRGPHRGALFILSSAHYPPINGCATSDQGLAARSPAGLADARLAGPSIRSRRSLRRRRLRPGVHRGDGCEARTARDPRRGGRRRPFSADGARRLRPMRAAGAALVTSSRSDPPIAGDR